MEQINQSVIDNSPNLKIISRRGVGVDSVAVKYAQSKGIEVSRTLNIVEKPVAELVIGYILEMSRNIGKLNSDMHEGLWKKVECHSINGKTLGIIGMGKIAYEVVKRAYAFGMEIIYFDLYKNEKVEADFKATKMSFDDVLKNADFVSIHTPLTEETNKLFGYDVICKMKETAYLINTSRGAVVDENGLYNAIKEKKIIGAAIDVFDVEPNENSILKELLEVILTPHVGTFTNEIFIEMDIIAAQNVVDYLKSF